MAQFIKRHIYPSGNKDLITLGHDLLPVCRQIIIWIDRSHNQLENLEQITAFFAKYRICVS